MFRESRRDILLFFPKRIGQGILEACIHTYIYIYVCHYSYINQQNLSLILLSNKLLTNYQKNCLRATSEIHIANFEIFFIVSYVIINVFHLKNVLFFNELKEIRMSLNKMSEHIINLVELLEKKLYFHNYMQSLVGVLCRKL